MTQAIEWLAPFEEFFQRTGLQQTLRALQIEAVVLPFRPDSGFSENLRTLADSIQKCLARSDDATTTGTTGLPGEHGIRAQSIVQNTMDRKQTEQMMDDFIAQQRKGIDSSNRDEFLAAGGNDEEGCARINARGANCGVKLQEELVQNDKTALGRSTDQGLGPGPKDDAKPPESQPLNGLEERVENIRDHLNVRFVPETADVYRRVSALEDRIMMLEREFPPWSAEHFNQPRRRYTQPPPVTVYRILPSAPASAAGSGSTAASPAPVSTSAHSRETPLPRKATPRTTPKQPPAKRKKASFANSPLDKTGKPIFHACGRGVNSSLTRSVLAQLQLRQKDPSPAPEQNAASPPAALDDEQAA
ncbi:hypothetical protein H4S02_003750 [Coemansia sp. RSA 2611]|nr:hypothetical protein H4S02_003750 [Coemansia sp. RSA 2611]